MVKISTMELKKTMKHKSKTWDGETTVDLTSSRVKCFLAFFLEPVFPSPFTFDSIFLGFPSPFTYY